MKKSILWTAAGVVSATALWAAISLPASPRARCTATYKLSTRATALPVITRTQFLSLQDSDGGVSRRSGPVETLTVEWDGKTLRHYSTYGRGYSQHSGPAHPLTLTIHKQIQEVGPNFSRTSGRTYTRTLQPGEKLDI
jgi:hypothetical protein